jgi:hypothetical protein
VPYKPTGGKSGRPKKLPPEPRKPDRVIDMPRPKLSDKQWAALQIELFCFRENHGVLRQAELPRWSACVEKPCDNGE